MASAERRARADAYIHPEEDSTVQPSKTPFSELIEGKNVWKPKLNKVVRGSTTIDIPFVAW